MPITLDDMRQFLSSSVSSGNLNKVRGIAAEVAFRHLLADLGFGDSVSPGGWIYRSRRDKGFGEHNIVLFPEEVLPGVEPSPIPPEIPTRLHSVGAHFRTIGVRAFYCRMTDSARPLDSWMAKELAPVQEASWQPLDEMLGVYLTKRPHKHNYLSQKADVSGLPDAAVPDQYTKELIRVAASQWFLAETSDMDGVFWGDATAYHIEIKEKTAAPDKDMGGEYFGLDMGPFTKLAFFAANKGGNMHSLFVVREVADRATRALVQWWIINFETLARYASWVPIGGGTNMRGGGSTVVKVPKSKFLPLTAEYLDSL